MQDVIIIVITAFLAIALWWFYTTDYRAYRVDLLRQRLFEIRHGLFSAAEKGTFEFNHPVYTFTRTTLNGMLRFAHELSLLRFIAIMLAQKASGVKNEESTRYLKHLDGLLKNVSKEGRELILEAHLKMHVAVLAHLIFINPVIGPLVILVERVRRTRELLNEKAEKIVKTGPHKKKLYALDAQAHSLGRKTQPAH